MTKEEIIDKRKDFLPYEEAEKLQKRLINIYKKEYKPKHKPPIYLKLILDWDVGEIEERHPQANYFPDTVFECFSEVSQHVYGYTKEHCLDQIYEAVSKKKKRIKEYKKLPTLEQLVNSDIEILPDVMYKTKEVGADADSCDSYSGDIILEIREIGMAKYKEKTRRDFFNWAEKMYFSK